MPENSNKGFTLVELLIVIAILAILAAIALPQFSRYKLRAFHSETSADINKAYKAAQDYLLNDPSGEVTILGDLTSGGFTLSPNVTFVSANMKLGSGRIVLSSGPIKAQGLGNLATVFYNSRMTLPPMP